MAERRSALAAYAARFAALGPAVRIEERPFLAMVTLRVDPKGPAADGVGLALGAPLPVEPGSTAAAEGRDVLWLGPDEWLLIAPPGTQSELVSRLRAAVGDEHGSVVDTSAARTALHLAGPHARDVLAHGCPLDLHPRAFPARRCAQSLLARERVVLLAQDNGILVLVRTSASRYLADWLLDAATEFAPR
jgi:sarcosine oxidase subunit gamma